MDKINDIDNNPKSFGRANANENIDNKVSSERVSFTPPAFQLQDSSSSPHKEEKEEAANTKDTYQLAAEGSEPPVEPETTNSNEDGTAQPEPNNTGLPNQLKSGVEHLSGFSLNDVNVHYNSSKPAQLQAHAYAQGSEIHLGPGQERHLPHEAWHVVQQKQGRVEANKQLKGVSVNDDSGLEKEADVMGAKAMRVDHLTAPQQLIDYSTSNKTVQRVIKFSITEFLHGAAPTQAQVDRYVKEYLFPDINLLTTGDVKKSIKGTDQYKALTPKLAAYSAARAIAIAPAGDLTTLPPLILELETLINATLEAAKAKGVDIDAEYSNTAADSWETNIDALEAMDALATASALPDITPKRAPKGGAKHPDIPQMAWSNVMGNIPKALQNLIRDLYHSWRIGQVMDERTAKQKEDRNKKPNIAGALRSWHVNEQGQLPDNSSEDTPANATDLHDHYSARSRHPYKKDKDVKAGDGPSGYAEYTGTGMKDDFHNSKIVLDYKSGLIYLTVTHYWLWDKKVGKKPVPKNKTAESGTQSAWFAIDMES